MIVPCWCHNGDEFAQCWHWDFAMSQCQNWDGARLGPDIYILQGNCSIFEDHPLSSFHKILRNIILNKDNKGEFDQLGRSALFFGTHSICNEAPTHMVPGTATWPPITTICIQAGLTLLRVLNRYIQFNQWGVFILEGALVTMTVSYLPLMNPVLALSFLSINCI
jgi:hypothetical protein